MRSGDALPTYDPKQKGRYAFSGKRVKCGLYRARDGRTLNADVNGSYNILRKALPDAFGKGIEAVVVWPVWLTFAWSAQSRALAAA
jgi:putative transposase